uniref:DnaJ_C domain-containing protein n=1 Tax=Caenorhabditis japonica TaxID=281687 RepID=A0A8R1HYP9_CAEJA
MVQAVAWIVERSNESDFDEDSNSSDNEVEGRMGAVQSLGIKLSVNKALCGYNFHIKHLDGHPLILRGKPGDIIKPGTVKGVVGKGIPNKKYPELQGNLFVEFDVGFPTDHFLEVENAYNIVRGCLPLSPKVNIPVGAQEISIMEYDEKKYSRGRGGDAYNEDSDDEQYEAHGARGVRCQQQ